MGYVIVPWRVYVSIYALTSLPLAKDLKKHHSSTGIVDEKNKNMEQHMCQGLNSHYFHIIGDGHQPNSRGLYTLYKDSY